MRRSHAPLVAVLVLAASAAAAKTIVVHPGGSIQAAIDAASPGTTISVEPGTYHESGAVRGLTVTKNNIRLVAKRGGPVVLEGSGGQEYGVWVSPDDSLTPADDELPPCGVSGRRVARFRLSGFTIQGFGEFGVYLACVDGFGIDANTVHGGDEYSIFPVRSSHGRMTKNIASGTSSDACLYVGQSERITVARNRATDCQIGLQIENCTHVTFTHNESTGNTAGMIVDVIDKRQAKVESDNRVIGNDIHDNNRPNGAPPDAETSDLLPGIGLVIDGADRTVVSGNTFAGQSFAGITLVQFCLGNADACGPGLDIDPNPDGNRVVRNTFSGNTTDVVFLPRDGQGNCFAHNTPATLNATGNALPPCR